MLQVIEESYYRINGDTLNLHWNPNGTLSTAMLYIKDSVFNVASQLPGINTDNCEEYLTKSGFYKTYSDDSIDVAKKFRNTLLPEFCLESVRESPKGYFLSLINEGHRKYVCPIRVALLLLDRKANVQFLSDIYEDIKEKINQKINFVFDKSFV